MPQITATSQQSRFAASDIGLDFKQVNISVDGRDLLVDAHLQLLPGVHYALCGRNGVGKTALLTSLANGSLLTPQLRETTRIMLINQSLESQFNDDRTVMEELLIKPWSGDLTLGELEKYKQLADQLSGQRGFQARQTFTKLQKSQVEQQDLERGHEQYDVFDELLESTEELSFDEMQSMKSVLKSVGITEQYFSRPMHTLSGGFQMRVYLAKALLYTPDLLLCDEINNHLDIQGIQWLQKCIKSQFSDITMLFVSHDRSFMNQIADEVILFKNKTLEYFTGNYDQYLETLAQQTLYKDRAQNVLERKKAAMAASILQSSSQASKHGDDKRLKQLAGKKVKLNERMGYERNEKGHRFKLNRDRVGYHDTTRGEVETVKDEQFASRLNFYFSEPELPRFAGPLLVADEVCFKRTHKGQTVLELSNITFSVSAGDRIAIIARNGAGKSTILKLLFGELSPLRGNVQCRVKDVGYYRQDVVKTLGTIQKVPVQYLAEKYPQYQAPHLWKILGSYGLGSIANSTPLSALSGGQRVAFAFAELSINAPSLLLLDEPNSHLSIESLESLTQALLQYKGAIVFVAHDLTFLQEVGNIFYLLQSGSLTKYDDTSKLLKKLSKLK